MDKPNSVADVGRASSKKTKRNIANFSCETRHMTLAEGYATLMRYSFAAKYRGIAGSSDEGQAST